MESHQSIRQVIICLLHFLFFLPGIGKSTTWNVNKSTQLNSVQKAIELAHPNDTILVYPGIYFEKNIIIKKPMLLLGMNQPILDGENKYEIISIWSSNVTVEGFELRNSGRSSMNDFAGIKSYNAQHVTIRNNILKNMFFGIYFQGCSQSTASGNILQSTGTEELQSGNGIHCWKCDRMTIENNNVSGQRDGIYFEFVTNSIISNNISHKNIRYGLHFMFSHHNDYLDNTFENNGAGVAVMYTNHVKMLRNTFKDNWGSAAYGLLLKEISDSEVKNNIFSNNSSGIYMEGSSRIIVENNNFKNNGIALRIQASCDNNVIEKNNFKGNTFDVTTNGSLILNTFINNYWDKYEGYDLNHDGKGDVPYHPVSVYSMIIERMPVAMILMRSFMVSLLEKTEKAIPSITPENFKDDAPLMNPLI
ncbi:MAG: nitrous oxide reductase family maturation protein NosD [Bacteroidota bacterium]